ncbi:MAG: hypothetical protein KDD19_14080 [Phaeodactylibacter sp.]|nr:hypothetical protein [Phaeodactylibacter sp.]MCB9051893.1 hypothetical protein [Lewinellaceae bacterium]
MELHVQQCQHCGSDKMKNILFRQTGEPDKVYVQCQDCGQFVASYALAPLGYYHHGKGYESFLRSIYRSGEFMSGRNFKRQFEQRIGQEVAAFEEVMKKLRIREEKKNN